MYQTTKLPTISASEHIRTRLIPDLEKELATNMNWLNEKEKQDQENLLATYKAQLEKIDTGLEKDGFFPDMVIELNPKTGEKIERARTAND